MRKWSRYLMTQSSRFKRDSSSINMYSNEHRASERFCKETLARRVRLSAVVVWFERSRRAFLIIISQELLREIPRDFSRSLETPFRLWSRNIPVKATEAPEFPGELSSGWLSRSRSIFIRRRRAPRRRRNVRCLVSCIKRVTRKVSRTGTEPHPRSPSISRWPPVSLPLFSPLLGSFSRCLPFRSLVLATIRLTPVRFTKRARVPPKLQCKTRARTRRILHLIEKRKGWEGARAKDRGDPVDLHGISMRCSMV